MFKLRTPYARIHAAGRASPVAFLIAGVEASVELGWDGAARLVLAGAALILTLRFALHLLFRALHNTEPQFDPPVDELAESGADVCGPAGDGDGGGRIRGATDLRCLFVRRSILGRNRSLPSPPWLQVP